MITAELAKEDDFKRIAEIEKECFQNPWSEEELLRSYSSDCIFIAAKEEGKIGAYCGAQISDGAYITNVATAKDFRSKGFAKAALSELISLCRTWALPFVTLEVRVSNTTAISLYESLGFENLGRRPNFYTSPREDAYIYTLELH